MKETRRKYEVEFKQNAVKLTYESRKGAPQIAEALGNTSNLLYRWKQRYTVKGNLTERTAIELEPRATQRELAEMKLERDM